MGETACECDCVMPIDEVGRSGIIAFDEVSEIIAGGFRMRLDSPRSEVDCRMSLITPVAIHGLAQFSS